MVDQTKTERSDRQTDTTLQHKRDDSYASQSLTEGRATVF